MKKVFYIIACILLSCDTGNLKVIADLPTSLKEASGIVYDAASMSFWMLNDAGNKAELYQLNAKGKITHVQAIAAKNNDWEDLTADDKGHLYIGNFGNNANKRKNLAILKVNKNHLNASEASAVERISFYYPDQKKFPPKKKRMHFDCEAFFYYQGYLYLFTKSREKQNFGKTNLYKVPAEKGHHQAQLIGSFTTCKTLDCWVTSADISSDGSQIALLSPGGVWVFSNYENDHFFDGDVKAYAFDYLSQKESVCFKNNNTLYITDESAHGSGGNLYEFTLD